MRSEDGSLISKCLEGDSLAFGLLVDKYKAGIFAIIYDRLGNFEDAEDATQEVFIKAYKDLPKLRRWDSFALWLYTIAYNYCKNWLRAKSARPDREFIEDQDPEKLDSPSFDSYRDDLVSQSLHESLQNLPENYRKVLILYYMGGWNSVEIAKIIGTTEAAIRQQLTRARALLREEKLDMMNTTFQQNKLQASFTFRIVEAVKRIKLHKNPQTTNLPWGISLATGLLIAIFSISPNIMVSNWLNFSAGFSLPVESKILNVGEIPVFMVKTSDEAFMGYKKGKDNNINPQNSFLMAPSAKEGTWTQKGDMPNPRTATCSAVVNGKIYVIGGGIIAGQGQSIVEEYDPIKDTWIRKTDMPTPRFLSAAAVVNDKIYVIGGGQSLVTYLNTLEEYDPVTDKWTTKSDMPTQRGMLDAEAVNGKIYAIGGYSANNTFGIGIVEEYDPKLDTWTKKANMNVPRYALSTSIINGRIYAIGGSQGPSFSTVELYDPAVDKWEIKNNMPSIREYLSTAVVDGKIYAFGGIQDGLVLNGMDTVEMYDPETDTWTIKPKMPEPNLAFSCESVNQRIYIIGGESSFVFFGNCPILPGVHEYNPLGLDGFNISVSPQDKLIKKWGEVKR
jgi:RNA polymerase sigma factor (sigma-70 family)